MDDDAHSIVGDGEYNYLRLLLWRELSSHRPETIAARHAIFETSRATAALRHHLESFRSAQFLRRHLDNWVNRARASDDDSLLLRPATSAREKRREDNEARHEGGRAKHCHESRSLINFTRSLVRWRSNTRA